MRKYVICVLIACILTQSCAYIDTSEEKVEDNSLNAFTTKTSSEASISPRWLHHDDITAEDEPDPNPEHNGHIRFEDNSPSPSVKFKDENKDHQETNVNHITFKDDNRVQNSLNQYKSEESGHDINYNGPFQPHPQQDITDNSHTYSNDGAELEDDYNHKEVDDENEYNYNDEPFDAKANDVTEKNNNSKPVVFKDDESNKDTNVPTPTKKRRRPRKPRVYSPGYPGSGYRGPNYPRPENSNTNYPTNPQAGSPFYPTPVYPEYTPYPYIYPGQGPYSPYQGGSDPRPQRLPVRYPSQNGQVTQDDTNRPGQSSALSGQPGPYSEQDYAGAGYQTRLGYPAYPGQGVPHPGYYRPPRPQKSLTQRAVSAVAEALTSIALYDDKQCVPRLLCEVASGSAGSNPTVQKATAGLGPLITVLQAYNGASSSPLFLFGRAAVLGMTTRGNPVSCRYAYPQCPNDPAALVNYLNNHNGGFFRFFGQPEKPNKQQNLEQFYSHLSGQYGYQQQSQKQPQQQNQQQGQQQNYGQGYGIYNPYTKKPTYGNNYYREQNSFRNAEETDSDAALTEIEARIQTKPVIEAIEDEKIEEENSKWTFPDEVNHFVDEKPKRDRKTKRPRVLNRPARGERGGTTLKFPDDKDPTENKPYFNRDRDYIRNQYNFPDEKGPIESKPYFDRDNIRNQYYYPNNNHYNFQTSYQTTTPVNLDEYYFDHKHKFYVKRPKAVVNDNSQTLYIVRGNGDPNHPEIVKLRPGQRA